MKNYVLGFITDGKKVLLIRKNKPTNQNGLYNGIGGLALENELPLDAMTRKAKDETGLNVSEWIKIDTLDYPDDKVILHLYQANVSKKFIKNYTTKTNEIVRLFKLKNLPQNIVEDVPYICKKRLVQLNTQKEIFQISYLDELGHGFSNYYLANESQIKRIVKELFDKEKLNASNEDEMTYGKETPLFSFDENTFTGYVIKTIGFTLKHYIKWEKISSNINHIPKYELIENHYMCRDVIGKFSTLKHGLNKLKKVSFKSVKNYKLAAEDWDGKQIKQGALKKDIRGNYTCNYYYWDKTSVEHDEWDIHSFGFVLEPCKLIRL